MSVLVAMRLLELLVDRLGLKRVHPNYYTIAGLILALVTPILAYIGYSLQAIVAMMVSSLMDALDGYIARITGLQSKFGAFLDSLSDRISDASYILALNYMGANELLCYTLLVASYLISYARARGEGLGVQLKGVGLIERQERVIALIVIAIVLQFNVNLANVILGLLVLLSLVTVAQRVYTTYNTLTRGTSWKQT